jgi:hypothetical protein
VVGLFVHQVTIGPSRWRYSIEAGIHLEGPTLFILKDIRIHSHRNDLFAVDRLCIWRYHYAFIVFHLEARRDFLRAAVFLWMSPFVTALSKLRVASFSNSGAFSVSCCSTATKNFFTEVRIADFCAALWARRASFVLARLIADLILANGFTSR